MKFPGQEEYNSWLDAGFSRSQADAEMLRQREEQAAAGFAPKQIDEYWGTDASPLKAEGEQFLDRVAANGGPRVAKTSLELLEAGWDQSVSGLLMGKPDVVLPKDAGLYGKIVSGIGSVAGDLPAMIAGAVGGGMVGTAAEGGLPGPGSVVGGLYGSGFLPGYMRKSLMSRYEQGNVTSWQDFWGRMGASVLQGNKEGVINTISMKAGGAVGGKVLAQTDSELLGTASNLVTQATTMTAVGGALEGHVPDLEDFVASAALVGGLHAAFSVAGALPNARVELTPGGEVVARRMRELYAKTGITPDQARGMAAADPSFKAELLGESPVEPRIEGQTEFDRFQERWKGEDDKWTGKIDGEMTPAEVVEYDAYERKKLQEARDLGLTDEDAFKSPLRDADMPPDSIDSVEGITSDRVIPPWEEPEKTDVLDKIAGTVFREDTGKLVPDQRTIGSYLQAFGKLAGFNFIVGEDRSPDLEYSQRSSINNAPHYQPKSRTVYMPDTPDELTRRWYGLGRYEIIYHEVGHAIDYALGRLHMTAFTEGEKSAAVQAEVLAASKVFKPGLWAKAPKHTAKPSELMADAIAVYISNMDNARANMPNFGKAYGKLLEPYIAMAQRALPVRTEKGWVPPRDPENPQSTGGGAVTPPGGGRGGDPPYQTVFPPPEGPRHIPGRVPDAEIELQDFMEGMVGERPKQSWWRLFSPRKLMRDYISELAPGRAFDLDYGTDPANLGIEDMLRQTYASASRAVHFIRYGGLDALSFGRNDRPAYEAAWRLVQQNGGTAEGFEAYRVARRTVELANRGIRSGFDLEAATRITSRRENQERYGAAERLVNEAKDGVVQYGFDSGLFTERGFAAMLDLNKSHIVLRRVLNPDYNPPYMSKRRGFNAKVPVKRIQGSDRMVLPPTVTDMENIFSIVAAADRNRAVGAIIGRIEEVMTNIRLAGVNPDFALKRIEQAGRPRVEVIDEEGNVVYDSRDPKTEGAAERQAVQEALDSLTVWKSIDTHRNPGQFVYIRDGIPEIWETSDHDLARMLREPQNAPELHGAMFLASKFAEVLRVGIVGDPTFPLKSVARGEFSAAINMPGWGIPFKGLFEALLHVYHETPEYQEAMRAGATGGTFLAMDMAPLKENLDGLFRQTGVYNNAWNFIRHPIDAVKIWQDRLYTAQAVSQYFRHKRGESEDPKAAMTARRALTDMSEAAGLPLVNSLHRISMFLRPSMLDIAQFGRALRERPISTSIKIMSLVAIPAALEWAGNQAFDSQYENDPEFRAANPAYVPYRELPRWQRENAYILPPIGGVRLRLPMKPYTVGFFGGMVQRAMDAAFLNDKEAFTNWWQSFEAQVIPSFIPAVGLPVYEIVTNRRMVSDSPLIPAYMEGATSPMMYLPDTSEAAKLISKAISPDIGILSRLHVGVDMSPIALDTLVRGWLGPVPQEIQKALESPFHDRSHPRTIGDLPIVRGFVAMNPGAGSQVISDFYDASARLEKKGVDWALAVRRMNEQEMQTAGAQPGAFVRLTNLKTALSNQSMAIRAIQADKNLTNNEKLKQESAIYATMVITARAGLDLVHTMEGIQ